MVGIGAAYRNNLKAGAYLQLWHELFLQPELLESNLASALNLFLIFAPLFGLELHGGLDAAVFELYLRRHRPSLAEIITEIYNNVRHVETAVAVAGIFARIGIAQVIVAEEVLNENRFAVAADMKAVPGTDFFCDGASERIGRFGDCGSRNTERKSKNRGDNRFHLLTGWNFSAKLLAAKKSRNTQNLLKRRLRHPQK